MDLQRGKKKRCYYTPIISHRALFPVFCLSLISHSAALTVSTHIFVVLALSRHTLGAWQHVQQRTKRMKHRQNRIKWKHRNHISRKGQNEYYSFRIWSRVVKVKREVCLYCRWTMSFEDLLIQWKVKKKVKKNLIKWSPNRKSSYLNIAYGDCLKPFETSITKLFQWACWTINLDSLEWMDQ